MATCTFEVLVTSNENELARAETIDAWDYAITNRTVAPLRIAYYAQHIVSEGGDVATFTGDLSSFSRLELKFQSPSSNVPFVVRQRPEAVRGRFTVDMQWETATATPVPFHTQQANTLALLHISGFKYDDEPNATPTTLRLELLEQQIVASETTGQVGVRAQSEAFTRAFSFTSIALELRFPGIADALGEEEAF